MKDKEILSIEEKAKAYDEALERASNLHKDAVEMENNMTTKTCEIIFPELKESEDERIRKFLINEVMGHIGMFDLEGDRIVNNVRNNLWKKSLAWLEKQGEPKEINPSEFDSQLNRLLGQFKSLPKEELASSLSFYLNVVQNDGTYKEEKQGEQNPADKVEPKFHEGDWVVQKNLGIYKIVEVCESWYEVISYKDGIQYSIGFDKENDCHLWTIQDAKDGDVLASKDGNDILIFRNIEDNLSFLSYYNIERKSEHYWAKSSFIPATKEQRDTLMKAMHEAGYEWDADKKELKDIEQNPAWSEEDETVIHNLVWAIANDRIRPQDRNDYCDWLKSLKDRVQPQHTWKPSEHQIKSLQAAINIVGDLTLTGIDLKELLEQLNKLIDEL